MMSVISAAGSVSYSVRKRSVISEITTTTFKSRKISELEFDQEIIFDMKSNRTLHAQNAARSQHVSVSYVFASQPANSKLFCLLISDRLWAAFLNFLPSPV